MPNLVATPTLFTQIVIDELTSTLLPESTLRPGSDPALPTATLPPDSGWQQVYPGFELRTIRLFNSEGVQFERLTILRIDPAQVQFQVGYHPGNPQTLSEWQAETGALLVVNGGFFTETFAATGLVVVDGEASGSSFSDFGGMFAVSAVGVEVRWLGERPYSPDESLDYALQAFPMLVRPGGIVGFPEEDGRQARRTVVGQDENGRILFIIAPRGGFTLHGLSTYLVASDLKLNAALNLDGGPSSGMVFAAHEGSIPAYSTLPAVILVYANPE